MALDNYSKMKLTLNLLEMGYFLFLNVMLIYETFTNILNSTV